VFVKNVAKKSAHIMFALRAVQNNLNNMGLKGHGNHNSLALFTLNR